MSDMISGQDVLKDGISGLQVTISAEHNAIHRKLAFTATKVVSIAAGKTAAFQFTTPSSGYIHFKTAGIIPGGGPLTGAFSEDVSFTGVGTAIVPVNRNRMPTVPASASTIKYLLDAAAALVNGAGALVLDDLFIPGSSSGPIQVSGTAKNDEEWLEAQGKNYTLTLMNGTSGAITVKVEFFWYERV